MVSLEKIRSFVHVQEICFVETNPRVLFGYYFSRSRPPEIHAYVKRIQWWRLFSLRDIGWEPPDKLCSIIFYNYFVMITPKRGHVSMFCFLSCLELETEFCLVNFFGKFGSARYTSMNIHSMLVVK